MNGTTLLLLFIGVYFYLDYKQKKRKEEPTISDIILTQPEFKIKDQWGNVK